MHFHVLNQKHTMGKRWHTYLNNDEDSTNCEADGHHQAEGQACIQYYIKHKIYIIIPCIREQAKETNRALETDEEIPVMDIELVKASENVLLDVGHRSVVAGEDATGRDAHQDAEDGQESQ